MQKTVQKTLKLSFLVSLLVLSTNRTQATEVGPEKLSKSEVCRIALMTDDQVGNINSLLGYKPQHTHNDPFRLLIRGPRGIFEMKLRLARKVIPLAGAVGVDLMPFLDPESKATFEDFTSEISEKLNESGLTPLEVLREISGNNPYLNSYADSFEEMIGNMGASLVWNSHQHPVRRTLPERPNRREISIPLESLLYDDAASSLTVEIAHQINHAASLLPEPSYIETFTEFIDRGLTYFIEVEAKAAAVSLQIKSRLMGVTINPDALFFTDLEEDMLKVVDDPSEIDWRDLVPIVRDNLKPSFHGELTARWIKYWGSRDSISLNAGLDSALAGHVTTDDFFITEVYSVAQSSPLRASLPPYMKNDYPNHLVSYLALWLQKDGQTERANRLVSLATGYGFDVDTEKNPLRHEYYTLKMLSENPLLFSTIEVDENGQMQGPPN